MLVIEEESTELKKMASGLHSGIIMNLTWQLAPYVYTNKLGRVFDSSATYNFNDNLPKRQPDLSFMMSEKMPKLIDEEITAIPDLVVEVVSKNDTDYEVRGKIKQYKQAKVRLIWIIHPADETVEVHRLNENSVFLTTQDELDGEDVLVGFKLPVKNLFG